MVNVSDEEEPEPEEGPVEKPAGFLEIGDDFKKPIMINKVSYYYDMRLKTNQDKAVPIDLYEWGTERFAGTFKRSEKLWLK